MAAKTARRDATRRKPGAGRDAPAGSATSIPDPVLEPLVPALTAAVVEFARTSHLPGASVGIVRDGRLAWTLGVGHADVAARRLPDQRTLYRVASITKTFTATAVLQLRDEGRLRLDDPAVRFIPELAAVRNPFGPIEDITIRRLLMHTSGLQGEEPSDDPDVAGEHLAADIPGLLDRVRVAIPPETDHKYCNLGYILLGLVVERVSGRPYPDYVRRNITRPLGMDATTFDPFRRLRGRVATGYNPSLFSDDLRPARDIPTDRWLADGGLWSCVEDLATWILQQLRREDRHARGEGQVLDGRTLREMHRPSFLADSTWKEAQGLGWYAVRRDDCVLTGHSGTLHGFRSNASFSIPDELGAIVLCNGIADASALAHRLIELVLPTHRTARKAAAVLAPRKPLPDAYRELLGAYRDIDFDDDVRIEWRAGELVLVVPDEPEGRHPLEPTDDPLVFTIRGGRPGGEALRFMRGPDGAIDRCNAAGYPMVRVVLARQPALRA